ncbi:M56 family metallopeptidase [Arenimonas daejeonensis]|uniref:M56 family metallopeptidase n=1 Tax=Arenimonas daejeonensis TaxID=370777 RepID=UPI0011BF4C7D|nr:M56 family metallopeptidase [Arenimonas daejeonensis]
MIAALSGFTATLGWALVHFLWQGLLVGLAAALALALLGNARPQLRYAVACAALALCLVLPVATVLRGTTAVDAPSVLLVAGDGAAPGTAGVVERLRQPIVENSRAWRVRLQPWLPGIVALWSLGTGLFALRMALGLAWVARAAGPGHGRTHPYWQAQLDALAERMELPRRVLLRVVDELDGPVVARIWRPVVIVPAALVARLPADLLEALLAHELAHVRRHDYLVNLVQSAVEALLFYHPVVWWLSRRIRIEREQIADDLAAQALGEPRRLALALNELAQFRAPTPHLAPAAHGGQLMSRIQRLVRPRKQTLSWKLALPILALSAAGMTVFAQGHAAVAADVVAKAEEPTRISLRAGQGTDYAVVGENEEDSIKFTGHYDQITDVRKLRRELGGNFIWFRRDGRAYVIRDPALVARARQAWQPTQPVGDKMDALGDQMEVHGEKMEAIGERMESATAGSEPISAEMEKLGEQMGALGERIEPLTEAMLRADNDAERDRLSAEMDQVSAQMETLGERMETLGAQLEAAHAPLEALGKEMELAGKPMEDLGAQMEVLGKEMEILSDAANRETLGLIDQALRDGKAEAIERL